MALTMLDKTTDRADKAAWPPVSFKGGSVAAGQVVREVKILLRMVGNVYHGMRRHAVGR